MCTELNAREAADLLKVSLVTFNQILDQEEIPYRQVGSQRLVSSTEVIKYKSNLARKGYAALSGPVAYGEEISI
jgi:excisionase family DNA binding protein